MLLFNMSKLVTKMVKTLGNILYFQNWFLSVGLLGVFIALILIDGVIILILDSDKYHFN